MDNNEILFAGKWLSLRKTEDGYEYSHDEIGEGRGVAILVYNSNNNNIVLRYERTPCHNIQDVKLTSITGMIEKGEYCMNTVWKELHEEVGIEYSTDFNYYYLGTIHPSKASDYQTLLYAIDVGNTEIGEIKGDGTDGEKDAYCKWGRVNEIMQSDDSLNACMILRLYLQTGIKLF